MKKTKNKKLNKKTKIVKKSKKIVKKSKLVFKKHVKKEVKKGKQKHEIAFTRSGAR